MDENWLFIYESIKKGWLSPMIDPVADNKYFEILKNSGVYFYNENARVKTVQVKIPKTEIDDSTKKPKEVEAKRVISVGGGGGGGY